MEEASTSYIVLGVALFMLLNSAAIAVYAERRIAGFIQHRWGPNRVGPLGLLQPIADVLKLILKEDVTPTQGNRVLQFIQDLGKEVPFFCYHPAMSAPANCRQCFVKAGG